ncbi:hypothetical protein K504DRAFT_533233 [Pleomassaria siparia CBS 279.74]|uniref:Uncharacterized protein n=1 Tax=Pleomassaria siparia CBS 279.74 TaxID=1314801 RepID=A0A6G1KD29_9PLEO|nr:hypothetical protein K504DRAFT_533233 [Pleomassaria siparia CBS 279.74]
MLIELHSIRALSQPNMLSSLSRISAYRTAQRLPLAISQSRVPIYHKSTSTKPSPPKRPLQQYSPNVFSRRTPSAPAHATISPPPLAKYPAKYVPYTSTIPAKPIPQPRSRPARAQLNKHQTPRGPQGLSPALAGWLMGVGLMGAIYTIAWWYDAQFLLQNWWMSATIMAFLLLLVF